MVICCYSLPTRQPWVSRQVIRKRVLEIILQGQEMMMSLLFFSFLSSTDARSTMKVTTLKWNEEYLG